MSYQKCRALPGGRSYCREERKIMTAEERREKARFRVLTQGAWDHAETQGGTPVACRRDLALDLVQAAKAGP